MRDFKKPFLAAVLAGMATAAAGVSERPFGKLPDGRAVTLYTLSNGRIEAGIMNYGGTLVFLRTPDRQGNLGDVVLGFDSLEGYLREHPYIGALVGRYGNRIANGRFNLEGKTYTLARNNGPNHLHGGVKGFDKQFWEARAVPGGAPAGAKSAAKQEASALELRYVSKDGEEGYPGTLTVTVIYSLEDNGLKISYSAVTDRTTVVNLTNHAYFNLGTGSDIREHQLTMKASRFTPVDAGLIPTGELKPVAGTPFDFRTPMSIGARIQAADPQIALGGGYDHNFVLDSQDGSLALAAVVTEPKSGRVMEVWTQEPGVQFYTGNFLDGSVKGKGGRAYGRHAAFCLETQHFPDSPNRASFPSTVLKPGGRYSTTTVYRFRADGPGRVH
jgi:aldose 1-epimerase